MRNAKFMTQSSAPDVAFVGSCVVEMYGLDLARAYEHAFTYIKQLASLLRGAMSSQSKDAYREVYCWQTVNTLELWSKLLAAHHDKEVILLIGPITSTPLQHIRKPRRTDRDDVSFLAP